MKKYLFFLIIIVITGGAALLILKKKYPADVEERIRLVEQPRRLGADR